MVDAYGAYLFNIHIIYIYLLYTHGYNYFLIHLLHSIFIFILFFFIYLVTKRFRNNEDELFTSEKAAKTDDFEGLASLDEPVQPEQSAEILELNLDSF
jgi:hypothetical protein